MTRSAAEQLLKTRKGKNTQHTMLVLLRQAVYGRIAGYEDTNDADYLRIDPAMRRVVGGRAEKKLAASSSQVGKVRDGVSADTAERTGLIIPVRCMDRSCASTDRSRASCPGHGQFREPDIWEPGRHGLQWLLRMHVLPPAFLLQPVRRCRGSDAQGRQCP